MLRIYLAGYFYEEEYRKKVKELYSHKFNILDPIEQELATGSCDRNSIISSDLYWLKHSDIIVAYISIGCTYGTTSEIILSNTIFNKLVFVIDPFQKFRDEIWLPAFVDQFFNDIESCFNYIEQISDLKSSDYINSKIREVKNE